MRRTGKPFEARAIRLNPVQNSQSLSDYLWFERENDKKRKKQGELTARSGDGCHGFVSSMNTNRFSSCPQRVDR
jgi:hypothetical protein